MTGTEPLGHAIRRRWRNITNAVHGIDEYTDKHGRVHVGSDVGKYLSTAYPYDGDAS